MKRVRRRDARRELSARLGRQLEISLDPSKPRRMRTKASRYAACLAEKLGIISRPIRCEWCRRRRPLERHHWDHAMPLDVTFLCRECHAIADGMHEGEAA